MMRMSYFVSFKFKVIGVMTTVTEGHMSMKRFFSFCSCICNNTTIDLSGSVPVIALCIIVGKHLNDLD